MTSRIGWTVFFLATFFACAANAGVLSEDMAVLRSDCAFHFGDPVPSEIVTTSVRDSSATVRQVELKLRLLAMKQPLAGRLMFNCPKSDPAPASTASQVGGRRGKVSSPRSLIEREDAAGRYFRHVAWERTVSGNGWAGRVAYVDYAFGDGQKAYQDYLLLCHASVPAPCVEYIGDATKRLTKDGLDELLTLLRSLQFSER